MLSPHGDLMVGLWGHRWGWCGDSLEGLALNTDHCTALPDSSTTVNSYPSASPALSTAVLSSPMPPDPLHPAPGTLRPCCHPSRAVQVAAGAELHPSHPSCWTGTSATRSKRGGQGWITEFRDRGRTATHFPFSASLCAGTTLTPNTERPGYPRGVLSRKEQRDKTRA